MRETRKILCAQNTDDKNEDLSKRLEDVHASHRTNEFYKKNDFMSKSSSN